MKRSIFAIGLLAAVLAVSAPAAVAADADGLYASGSAGISLSQDDWRSDGTFLSAAVGYDFGAVRTEAEYVWTGDSGFAPLGNISVNALNANVVLEWENDTIFVPYAKAGVGYAWFDNSVFGDDAGLILNAGAGVRADVTDNLSLQVEYRYLTTDIEVVDFGGNKDFDANVVSVGVTFDL